MKFSELKDGELPVPPGIDEKFLADEGTCKRFGQLVTAYDPESNVGGVYHLGMRQWSLWWPLTFDQFADLIAHGIADIQAKMAEKPDVVN